MLLANNKLNLHIGEEEYRLRAQRSLNPGIIKYKG